VSRYLLILVLFFNNGVNGQVDTAYLKLVTTDVSNLMKVKPTHFDYFATFIEKNPPKSRLGKAQYCRYV
jgi:hypothetical protein